MPSSPAAQQPSSPPCAGAELSHSPDTHTQRQQALLAAIRQIAPEVASDQQIDFDRLKTLLGQERIAPEQEHYELSWAGKAAARREIQKTTSTTLLPAPGNPAHAPHMLIEGENLEVLRVLQKSYYGKVKMIYIDPPYNTGNDSFVYPDDYTETLEGYQRRTGERDASGFLNKQSLWKKNSKENGHYHSAWLSMMYPRLYLARNLLRDDGVIFISIDDNEAANLKLVCDEIFGEENFVANVVWQKKYAVSNDDPGIGSMHDHILVYQKSHSFQRNLLPRTEQQNSRYSNPDNDPRGDWASDNYVSNKSKEERPTLWYSIKHPISGEAVWPDPHAVWRYSKDKHDQIEKDGRLYWGPNFDYKKPRLKRYLSEVQNGVVPSTWWAFSDCGHNDEAQKETAKLISQKIFSTPKPIRLIKRIASIGCGDNGLILDFFAGSGTTMQAVMELNLEDGGNRQCICVQIPEKLEENTEAWKAGYRTIADITRARIDKVIEKLKAEQPEKTQDLACAQFTLAPSHFKQWRSDVDAQALREQLEMFQQAEKTTPQAPDAQTAMLAELLLKMGLGALGVQAISKAKTVAGVTVHRVLLENGRQLWLCFEPYHEALKDEIAQAHPAQVVMLNSCFAGDKADEQLANLQLELQGLDIGLTVI
ncbi:site-specific DNA-methyltransferase [Vandammella animalimorsus]|uniref:site-specific DNA-methyltransferase (adenine-specific) n=1 Tax=Vandammella animalimorsus TaxID=2029117 RepID=A0A2A2AGZ7_9BURK|nr:site-specific DNA-methyltransferase [Vandammella animalimorsus]PAT36869.1 site-specific DNA-methyltransferase [Vandammella animalimorsus]